VAAAFDSPARQALIPSLVPRNRIPAAMSLNILTGNVADVIGPAIGGFAIALIGVAGAYALNAASFVAVILAVQFMRSTQEIQLRKTGGIAAIREGLRFIWASPVIYGVFLLDFFATLFGSRSGLAPVFAKDVLDIGPQGLGILLSAPAAGAILAGTLLSVIPPPRRPGWTIVGAIAAYGVALAFFGLANSVWMAILFLGFAGAADAVSMTMRHTIRNLATPDRLRGRIAAAHSAFSSGGPYLGDFQSGMTAALIGPRGAMVAGGLACAGVAIGIAMLIPALLAYRFTDDLTEEPEALAVTDD
jgi:MFS family permease